MLPAFLKCLAPHFTRTTQCFSVDMTWNPRVQDVSTFEDETNTSSRNVGSQSPSDAASHLGRMETSMAPLRKPEHPHAQSLADPQLRLCIEQPSLRFTCWEADTLSCNGREFMQVSVLSSCPVFRISSGLMKFHVISNADVQIPLRLQHPPPSQTQTLRSYSHPPPPPAVLPAHATHG
jgi:hypothetical protein